MSLRSLTILLLSAHGLFGSGPAVLQAQDPTLDMEGLPQWSLSADIELGSADGVWDAFVVPSGVIALPADRIALLDPGIPAIRVFDDAGDFMLQVGRRGQGPGEYQAPIAMGLRGDSLWVVDQRASRLTFYSLDGDVLGSTRLRAGPRGVALAPVEGTPDGGWLAFAPPGPSAANMRTAGPIRYTQYTVRLRANGEIRDTVHARVVEAGMVGTGGGGVVRFAPSPPVEVSVQSSSGRRVSVSHSSDTRQLTIVSTPTWTDAPDTVRFSYSPMALPAQVADSLGRRVSSLMSSMSASGGSRARIRALLEAQIPTVQPPVSGLALDGRGNTWILRELFRSDPHWIVIDSSGSPIARVDVPRDGVPRRSSFTSDGRLWLFHEDEYGVPIATGYSVLGR